MRGGQKRARSRESFIKRAHKKLHPASYLESQLIQLDKMEELSRELWKSYQSYLAKAREEVLDQITYALLETSTNDFFQNNAGRIVKAEHSSRPLSCKGSYIKPPSGRFNFDQSISYQRYFPALYIASEYNIAYREAFRKSSEDNDKNLSELDLDLTDPQSFSYHRVNIFLDRVIDLRNDDPFYAFYDSIKHIEIPKHYREQSKKLNTSLGLLAQNSETLKKSILGFNYEQWSIWIDCPSPSQWFGHYTRLAGIQGVIYPSIRSNTGFNIAVFPDQFEDTSSYVELSDESDSIDNEHKKISAENFNIFL